MNRTMLTMMRSFLYVSSCLLLCLSSTGCATRYQQLLQDRDAEIRDLEGQVANLKSENAELARQKAAADARARDLTSGVAAESSSSDELARVRGDLPDLDVRYDRAGRISIGIENTVTFDSGSVQLKPDAGRVLQRVADVLMRDYPDRRIYVEGHTDTDPIRRTKGLYRSNRHLSVERADAVARYLVENGRLSESHIVVVGYGQHLPRAPGSSASDKARNRRVEVVVGEVL